MSMGSGRFRVKRRLEALRDADAAVTPGQRQYRTLTQEYIRQLCDEAGGISSPKHFLYYLHNAGVVFYREGIFADRIILDQAWALDAIYAVFNRESCYRQLLYLRGRFTRPLLEALIWHDYDVNEQEVFLGMMLSCGICFIHRRWVHGDEEFEEYIAPDLLPNREEVQSDLDAIWDRNLPSKTVEFDYAFTHPGVIRGVMARVGSEAGITGLYWRSGFCVYEISTGSRAIVELEMTDVWRGKIGLHTQQGRASELLEELARSYEMRARKLERGSSMKQGKTEDRCRCASRPMMMMMNRTDHENLGEFLISAKIVPKDISTLSLTHGLMTPSRDAREMM
jgi:internalin A